MHSYGPSSGAGATSNHKSYLDKPVLSDTLAVCILDDKCLYHRLREIASHRHSNKSNPLQAM